jgi:hypothetical protein
MKVFKFADRCQPILIPLERLEWAAEQSAKHVIPVKTSSGLSVAVACCSLIFRVAQRVLWVSARSICLRSSEPGGALSRAF